LKMPWVLRGGKQIKRKKKEVGGLVPELMIRENTRKARGSLALEGAGVSLFYR